MTLLDVDMLEGPHERLPQPSVEELMDWESQGFCESTDGCRVEPDGTCEHGCDSWLKVLGMI